MSRLSTQCHYEMTQLVNLSGNIIFAKIVDLIVVDFLFLMTKAKMFIF